MDNMNSIENFKELYNNITLIIRFTNSGSKRKNIPYAKAAAVLEDYKKIIYYGDNFPEDELCSAMKRSAEMASVLLTKKKIGGEDGIKFLLGQFECIHLLVVVLLKQREKIAELQEKNKQLMAIVESMNKNVENLKTDEIEYEQILDFGFNESNDERKNEAEIFDYSEIVRNSPQLKSIFVEANNTINRNLSEFKKFPYLVSVEADVEVFLRFTVSTLTKVEEFPIYIEKFPVRVEKGEITLCCRERGLKDEIISGCAIAPHKFAFFDDEWNYTYGTLGGFFCNNGKTYAVTSGHLFTEVEECSEPVYQPSAYSNFIDYVLDRNIFDNAQSAVISTNFEEAMKQIAKEHDIDLANFNEIMRKIGKNVDYSLLDIDVAFFELDEEIEFNYVRKYNEYDYHFSIDMNFAQDKKFTGKIYGCGATSGEMELSLWSGIGASLEGEKFGNLILTEKTDLFTKGDSGTWFCDQNNKIVGMGFAKTKTNRVMILDVEKIFQHIKKKLNL